MGNIKDADLLLQRVYEREKSRADELYMTQPMGGDRLETYSWARTLDEARRMAAYLRAQDFPPKSQIALISKNCAHFIMTDLAIWMAGHVSVALYPTLNAETVKYILEHSEAKMLFVGKLDTWDEMRVPASPRACRWCPIRSAPRTTFPPGTISSRSTSPSRTAPPATRTTWRSSSTPRAPPAAPRA